MSTYDTPLLLRSCNLDMEYIERALIEALHIAKIHDVTIADESFGVEPEERIVVERVILHGGLGAKYGTAFKRQLVRRECSHCHGKGYVSAT